MSQADLFTPTSPTPPTIEDSLTASGYVLAFDWGSWMESKEKVEKLRAKNILFRRVFRGERPHREYRVWKKEGSK